MSELKHTPGPWEWVVNKTYKQVTLVGHRDGSRELVMDFVRWGMNGAKPRLNCDGLMRAADGFCGVVEGREHHSSWFQAINHPDARLIAAAPGLLDALKYEMIRWKEKCPGCSYSCTGVLSVCPVMKYKNLIESATGLPIEEVLK